MNRRDALKAVGITTAVVVGVDRGRAPDVTGITITVPRGTRLTDFEWLTITRLADRVGGRVITVEASP